MQTSYELALLIGGPIYVCSGLALTAQAVAVSDGDFEFLSVEEIKAYCPGICITSIQQSFSIIYYVIECMGYNYSQKCM